MLIRLKSNIGNTRITLDNDTVAIKELKKIIKEKLNINNSIIELSLDNPKNNNSNNVINNDTLMLKDLNISNGQEVYLLGKYEKQIISNTYIDDSGQVIKAGTTYVRIDYNDSNSTIINNNNINSGTNDKNVNNDNPVDSKEEFTPANRSDTTNNNDINDANSNITTSQVIPEYADNTNNSSNETNDGNDEINNNHTNNVSNTQLPSPEVRAPDQTRVMNLLGDNDDRNTLYSSSANNDSSIYETNNNDPLQYLRPEDKAELDRYVYSLREAGLKEYDVQMESLALRDELIAKRIQKDIEWQSSQVNSAMMQGLQELEQFDRILSDFTKEREALERRSYGSNGSSNSNSSSYGQNRAMRLIDEAKAAASDSSSSTAFDPLPTTWQMRRTYNDNGNDDKVDGVNATNSNDNSKKISRIRTAGLRSLSAQDRREAPLLSRNNSSNNSSKDVVKNLLSFDEVPALVVTSNRLQKIDTTTSSNNNNSSSDNNNYNNNRSRYRRFNQSKSPRPQPSQRSKTNNNNNNDGNNEVVQHTTTTTTTASVNNNSTSMDSRSNYIGDVSLEDSLDQALLELVVTDSLQQEMINNNYNSNAAIETMLSNEILDTIIQDNNRSSISTIIMNDGQGDAEDELLAMAIKESLEGL